ncbi:MAG: enoyl-CoA hydratase-related protein [Actinomycetota bacterium]|nr:enoyl-CoA hydratase-related protein [Actinomycetota bacterium]
MGDELVIDRDGLVATVRLNRPESMNALSLSLKNALVEQLPLLGADDSVRAVILTGSGRGFCVGQDLREHAARLEAADPAPLSTVTEHYNPIITALATMPKPVVAAVNGMAAGAGASFTFACDFRIAAESASFLLAFAGVGLSLDSGASWTLPRLIGSARATALALLAEPVSASAALEMGLVNAVVPDADLLPEARALAARLAAGPTLAYAHIKEALHFSATATLAEALEREAQLQAASGRTQDHADAVQAFLAKQAATFTGH